MERISLDGLRSGIALALLAMLAAALFLPARHPTATTSRRAPAFAPPPATLTYDPSTHMVSFDTGASTKNAAVCVVGAATNGQEKLFSFNEKGIGEAIASFQKGDGGVNTNTYALYRDVKLARGKPSDASCRTGTLVASTTVTS